MKYWIIILCIILSSCINEDEYFYGDGYKLDNENYSEHHVVFDKEGDSTDINPLGYEYDCKLVRYIDYFDKFRSICTAKGNSIISPFVVKEESRFDNKFILIVQSTLELNVWLFDKYYYHQYIDSNYSKFENIDIWYWIINKIDDIIYGPYTKEMYLEKRVEIGVPDSLRFRFEVENKSKEYKSNDFIK